MEKGNLVLYMNYGEILDVSEVSNGVATVFIVEEVYDDIFISVRDLTSNKTIVDFKSMFQKLSIPESINDLKVGQSVVLNVYSGFYKEGQNQIGTVGNMNAILPYPIEVRYSNSESQVCTLEEILVVGEIKSKINFSDLYEMSPIILPDISKLQEPMPTREPILVSMPKVDRIPKVRPKPKAPNFYFPGDEVRLNEEVQNGIIVAPYLRDISDYESGFSSGISYYILGKSKDKVHIYAYNEGNLELVKRGNFISSKISKSTKNDDVLIEVDGELFLKRYAEPRVGTLSQMDILSGKVSVDLKYSADKNQVEARYREFIEKYDIG